MSWKYVQRDEDGKYRTTSSGGGGGGSSTFADLEDVSFSDLQNGQVPKYNSETNKWENGSDVGGLTKRWSGNIPANGYVDIDCSSYVSEGGTFIFVPQSTNHFGAVLVVLNEWATNVTSYNIGGVNLGNYSFSRPSAKHIKISMNNPYSRYAMLYQFT